MIASLAICAALTSAAGDPQVEWSAPGLYVEGLPFEVTVTVTAPEDGAPVAQWMLTPAAFTVDGKPLGERSGTDVVPLAGGARLELSYDLGPTLADSGEVVESFQLAYAKEYIEAPATAVTVLTPAPEGLDFMELPVEQLDDYRAVIDTNRGRMVLEFWPDVAPNHVRNFLDLSYTGFYDGLIFHRVIPGYMVQSGSPTNTGAGQGPRVLKAEFSQKRHERGVLSAARLDDDIDSASSHFFIMHGTNPRLDGKYSAFGKLLRGFDVLDAIANTPTTVPENGREKSRPVEPQVMRDVVVVLAPEPNPEESGDAADGDGDANDGR